MRVLITGGGGFVAQYVVRELLQKNSNIKIDAIVRSNFIYKLGFTNIYTGDLMDVNFVNHILWETKPDVIIHLASQSSVSQSWVNPNSTFNNNVNIFLNVLDAVRNTSKNIRVLSVGSSEEYGKSDSETPINEQSSLNPTAPYAVARVAQTNLACLYAENYGLDVVCSRSFNHYCGGQWLGFVVPDFIEKVKAFKNRGEKITTVNLKVVRDFIHVKDVAKAYLELITHGKLEKFIIFAQVRDQVQRA